MCWRCFILMNLSAACLSTLTCALYAGHQNTTQTGLTKHSQLCMRRLSHLQENTAFYLSFIDMSITQPIRTFKCNQSTAWRTLTNSAKYLCAIFCYTKLIFILFYYCMSNFINGLFILSLSWIYLSFFSLSVLSMSKLFTWLYLYNWLDNKLLHSHVWLAGATWPLSPGSTV